VRRGRSGDFGGRWLSGCLCRVFASCGEHDSVLLALHVLIAASCHSGGGTCLLTVAGVARLPLLACMLSAGGLCARFCLRADGLDAEPLRMGRGGAGLLQHACGRPPMAAMQHASPPMAAMQHVGAQRMADMQHARPPMADMQHDCGAPVHGPGRSGLVASSALQDAMRLCGWGGGGLVQWRLLLRC
jgi:hypothetical protein